MNAFCMVIHAKVYRFCFTLVLLIMDSFLCSVKSVAQEQKTEIMSQLQTIRYLMKKRGMECPPLNSGEVTGAHTLKGSRVVHTGTWCSALTSSLKFKRVIFGDFYIKW